MKNSKVTNVQPNGTWDGNYGLMYKLFYFGGGMLTQVASDPTVFVPTVSRPTQDL